MSDRMWFMLLATGVVSLAFLLGSAVRQHVLKVHVHLACVDPFTQQSFQTDRSITRVEVWPEAFALHRSDGALTLIQRTDNMVCNLSTEYPPDAARTTP